MLEHLERRGRDVIQPAARHLRHGADADARTAQCDRDPRLRLLADVRPDRNESARGLFPTRTSVEPSRRGRHAVGQRAGRDHGRGRSVLCPRGNRARSSIAARRCCRAICTNPEATDAAFANGWFHSGDCGHFDADGILWFEDRFKDVIKSGGENVASIEVEKALYAADPSVQEAAVVGLPHDRWGEAVTAVVVLQDRTDDRRKDA